MIEQMEVTDERSCTLQATTKKSDVRKTKKKNSINDAICGLQ